MACCVLWRWRTSPIKHRGELKACVACVNSFYIFALTRMNNKLKINRNTPHSQNNRPKYSFLASFFASLWFRDYFFRSSSFTFVRCCRVCQRLPVVTDTKQSQQIHLRQTQVTNIVNGDVCVCVMPWDKTATQPQPLVDTNGRSIIYYDKIEWWDTEHTYARCHETIFAEETYVTARMRRAQCFDGGFIVKLFYHRIAHKIYWSDAEKQGHCRLLHSLHSTIYTQNI